MITITKTPILYLVVPCYNEEAVIQHTQLTLQNILNALITKDEIDVRSKILFVDDGSSDATWTLIQKFNQQNPINSGLKLSRNKGHQNALLAGLMEAKNHADVVISLDADLQDDPIAISTFIEAYKEGNEIVYGVRRSRKNDSFFKRKTAHMFYHLMSFMGVDLVFDHSDYRLLSKRAIEFLETYSEVNLFLRGIIPQIGLKSTKVEFDRQKRQAGESKYPFSKMMSFALEGITSFSVRPIRFIMVLASLFILTSIAIIFYTLYRKSIGETVTGWAFLNISLWFIAGVQSFILALIGEYIGKIYSESKHRPRYFIEDKCL